MKFAMVNSVFVPRRVALFTRAWIEIKAVAKPFEDYTEVALFTRAWIEIGIVSPL